MEEEGRHTKNVSSVSNTERIKELKSTFFSDPVWNSGCKHIETTSQIKGSKFELGFWSWSFLTEKLRNTEMQKQKCGKCASDDKNGSLVENWLWKTA